MFGVPFVLADQDRTEQFALLARTRRLFRGFEVWTDAGGITWARKRVGRHCFGISLLGPGWVFDPHAQQRRAEALLQRRQVMHEATKGAREALNRIVAGLGLGPIAERVLWAVHQRIVQAKRSVVRIPDTLLAQAVWGTQSCTAPRHWRAKLTKTLQGLAWIHVTQWPEEGEPVLGQQSALLTHAADLRKSRNDGCDDDCPAAGSGAHSHFLVNVGCGFLGILEQLGSASGDIGVRTYDFKIRGKGATLQSLGKTGRLLSIYLPAKLGTLPACARFTAGQHRLLQAIVRETTRNTKRKRRDPTEAEVFSGNRVVGMRQGKSLLCPLLAADGTYVGFNGSKLRKGQGYRLTTPGGWLVKAGYGRDDLHDFLEDMAALAEPLGLIVVGVAVRNQQFLDLAQLSALAATPAGRQRLDKLHLRVYTAADYVRRWNAHFGWTDEAPALPGLSPASGAALAAAMAAKAVTQAALAKALEVDPSFLNKLLHGKKTWPPRLLAQAQGWISAQQAAEPERSPPTSEGQEASGPLLPLPSPLDRGDPFFRRVNPPRR